MVTTAGIVTSVDVTDGEIYCAPCSIWTDWCWNYSTGRSFINAVGVVTGIEVLMEEQDFTNVPPCLGNHSAVSESDEVGSYWGDDGIIVGFGTEGGAGYW